jgi:hypothetical protein
VTTVGLYLGYDRPGVMGAVIPVRLRGAGIGRVFDPQERAQNPAATRQATAVAPPMPWLAPVTFAV